MGARRPNPRLVKIHRTYTVDDVARLFGLHKNTVRNWIKHGLPTVDDKRPILIRGAALVEYLSNLRRKSKRPCAAGELYCLPCRKPQRPAFGEVEYVPLTQSGGNLRGLCPTCSRLIHRRVRSDDLTGWRAILSVTIRDENHAYPAAATSP